MGIYISHSNDYNDFTPIGESVLNEVNELIGEIEFGVFANAGLFWSICALPPWVIALFILTFRFNDLSYEEHASMVPEYSPLYGILLSGGIIGAVMIIPASWYFLRKRRSDHEKLKKLIQQHIGFYQELSSAEAKQMSIRVVYDQGGIKVETNDILYFLHNMMQRQTKK